jgi:hypothetical protein
VKEDEMGGTEEKCINCVGGKIKNKERPLGRPRRRWKVNVKMVVNKIDV